MLYKVTTLCARTALLKAAELVSSLVLMEAGSTMKEFEIQTNFDKSLYRNKWMLFWPRVLAYVLQFPVPYLLSAEVF